MRDGIRPPAWQIALLCVIAFLGRSVGAAQPASLKPTDLAVVVNTADPLSVAIGTYYAKKRQIPTANVVRVRFDYQRDDLPLEEFRALKSAIDRHLSSHVQAYALTWARPYRVGCKSITSAFAFGGESACATGSCRATGRNPYFNSTTARPSDLHMRLAMSIAAVDFQHAKALIDRGERADGTAPHGIAYLVTTSDAQRNVRAAEYPLAVTIAAQQFKFQVVQGAAPESAAKVMFLFTGAATVPAIERNGFLPGAIADHLTSFGGMLTDSPQMSSLRWLEAGATGSYGTVAEPCNFLGKFPHVAILMAHYLAGQTLIEAYWNSVQMPDEGLFIGEPLSAPFSPTKAPPVR